jgi:hypothetical protein
MTQDEIIEMAKQAGMDYLKYISEDSMKQVEAFVKLVEERTHTNNKARWYQEGVESEREACALIAAEWVRAYPHPSEIIANKIRERGQQ